MRTRSVYNGGCPGGTLSNESRVQQVGIDCCPLNQPHIPHSDALCGQSCAVLLPQTSQHNQTTRRVDSVQSDPQQQPTNQTNKKQKRMKWTHEMNSLIMREYYRSTKLETNMTDYRQQMYRAFKNQYPEIDITEQRIADQRRFIAKSNKISDIELEEMKRQIAQQLAIEAEEICEPIIIEEQILTKNTQPIEVNVQPIETNEFNIEIATNELKH